MTNKFMKRSLSVAEAKAHFSECIQTAIEDGYILITRYGKPVAAVVRVEDLEHLERLRAVGSSGGLASLAGGWEGSEDLVTELEVMVRSQPRNSSELP